MLMTDILAYEFLTETNTHDKKMWSCRRKYFEVKTNLLFMPSTHWNILETAPKIDI